MILEGYGRDQDIGQRSQEQAAIAEVELGHSQSHTPRHPKPKMTGNARHCPWNQDHEPVPSSIGGIFGSRESQGNRHGINHPVHRLVEFR